MGVGQGELPSIAAAVASACALCVKAPVTLFSADMETRWLVFQFKSINFLLWNRVIYIREFVNMT